MGSHYGDSDNRQSNDPRQWVGGSKDAPVAGKRSRENACGKIPKRAKRLHGSRVAINPENNARHSGRQMSRKPIPIWRVYAAKHPSDLDGEQYSGAVSAWRVNGWFWIKKNTQKNLWIRVRGLDSARWLCNKLNGSYWRQVSWRKRNPEKLSKYSASQGQKETQELRPAYIRRQLKTRKNKISKRQLKRRIQMRRARKLFLPLAIAGTLAQSCK